MRVEVFKRRKGWYWRLRAGNNRIVAIGGEPFKTQRSCTRSFWNTVVDMGDVSTIKVIR
jgi:uncharacterized protein YegP (UPF0339 family)